MNTAFENMTQTEHDFFERMKNGTEEERDIFRKALNILMTCFGDDPPGAVLALHLMRDRGVLEMHGFNVDQTSATAMLDFAVLNFTERSAPTKEDTVQ